MLKIVHRINTVAQLAQVPTHYGIELDLRADGKELIMHHDAFQSGERFEDLLKVFRHELIILNTKCEGLEEALLGLMQQYKVKDYFFLDLSLPFLVKYVRKGVRKIAVRFSEFEPLEFVMNFAGKVDWVWVDCFSDLPLNSENYPVLKKHFKICLVSPELQGHPLEKISEFKQRIGSWEIDAVCTKKPELW
ncbi:MAG: hypothetical protein NZM38_05005 [Cytophagales bacterium]|nr:hypothetical protein [Cytophagales bacterium]MDW8384111.1 hypothetical protein [Flammeovirgaceae bacterium]